MGTFKQLKPEEQKWLDAWLDETIEPEAFEALQDRLLENEELRAVMRRYLSLDSSLRECSDSPDSMAAAAWVKLEGEKPALQSFEELNGGNVAQFPSWIQLAAAAVVAFLLGTAVMYFRPVSGASLSGTEAEPSAEGFAVVEQLFDAEFPVTGNALPFRKGDSLGAETFRLVSGAAEIQFFSGAKMTLEGPAEISVKSAWEAICHEGAVRMNVPPAARGFKLHGPNTEIVDLGTEFGLEVRGDTAHLEVFDGEVEIRHGKEATAAQLIEKGQALDLSPIGPAIPTPAGVIDYPDGRKFPRSRTHGAGSYERWVAHRDSLATNESLIAYYTFDSPVEEDSRLVPDLKIPQNSGHQGAVILAERVGGRWAELKSALEFRRPGARVRVNLPGEFTAFTFAAWVRIDSLDRKYNALFMGDGYETGEPHWQIREDGALMLSVMVDDTKPNPGAPNDAGFHRVYYSPPVWEMSMSGQWLHLASVFDPAKREVAHYVNGAQVSSQRIEDKFYIDKLRIGNAEIGNWGLPFREDPWFAIRNLNGRMDEIAIFNAALSAGEIASLYEGSRD